MIARTVMPHRAPPLLAAAALLAACGGDSSTPPPTTPTETLAFPAMLNRDIDILFVVDDSGSMLEEQTALAAAFPEFVAMLGRIDGGVPNIHLGVVSTNVGTGGEPIGGCSTATEPDGDDGALLTGQCAGITDRFLSDLARPDGTREVNYTGTLAEQFSCITALGVSGCGYEQPLEAMRRALSPGRNLGFLRPNAALAVVFVGDEDDCSASDPALFGDPNAGPESPLGPRTSFRCFEFGTVCDPDADPRAPGARTACRSREDSPYLTSVASYAAFLRGLKADPSQVVVTSLIGAVDDARGAEVVADPNQPDAPALAPSCSSELGIAYPGFRLADFTAAFHGTSRSICEPTFAAPLGTFAARITTALGVPCFEHALKDADAAVAGVQATCTVTDRARTTGASTAVPACDDDPSGTCWRMVADAARCPLAPGNLRIAIDRPGEPDLTDVSTTASCAIE